MKAKINFILFSLILLSLSSCNSDKSVQFKISTNYPKDSIFKINGEYINLTHDTLKLYNDFALYTDFYRGGINLYVEDEYGEVKEDFSGYCMIFLDIHDTTLNLKPNDTLKCSFDLPYYKIKGEYTKVIANYNKVNSNELKINFIK